MSKVDLPSFDDLRREVISRSELPVSGHDGFSVKLPDGQPVVFLSLRPARDIRAGYFPGIRVDAVLRNGDRQTLESFSLEAVLTKGTRNGCSSGARLSPYWSTSMSSWWLGSMVPAWEDVDAMGAALRALSGRVVSFIQIFTAHDGGAS